MVTGHETTPEVSTKAYLMLTVTTLCWAANAVLGRLAVGEISPMAVVTLRWLGVLLLLVFFAREPIQRDWPVLRPKLLFFASMGALGFTTFNALFYAAAHYTSAINIGILQGSLPMFMLVGAYAAYRTPITGVQIAGVLLTVTGVLIVGTGGHPEQLASLELNRGDLMMVIACISYAIYAVALRRRPAVSALGLFTVMAAAAFLASIPLLLAEAALGHLQWPTPTGWVIVALISLFPSFLGQIFFINGVALIGPGRAGVFVNLVPVFASILAVVFLREPFQGFHALALSLVLGGIWLSERGKQA